MNRLTVLPNTAYTSRYDSVDKTDGIGMQGPSYSRALVDLVVVCQMFVGGNTQHVKTKIAVTWEYYVH